MTVSMRIVVVAGLAAALAAPGAKRKMSDRNAKYLNDPKYQPDKTELLWPDGAPGAKGDAEKDKPTLHFFVAPKDKANGSALVICPGGGYGSLDARGREGFAVAKWLNGHGVTCVVLQYRLGGSGGYTHPAMLQDGKRAMRAVRARAKELGIDPDRIGVMGFSAGGHLAATVTTLFDKGDAKADDPIERVSSRPDYSILVYPVMTLTGPYVHKGSRRNLLGEKNVTNEKLLKLLSPEKRVTKDTPPTLLIHSKLDKAVPYQNSVLFHDACKAHGVPVEVHLYEDGTHGTALVLDDKEKYPQMATWPAACVRWLEGRGLLGKKAGRTARNRER